MHTPSTTRRGLRRAAAAAVSAAALVAGVFAAAAPATAATGQSGSSAAVHVKRLCATPANVHQMACLALARTDVTQPAALRANAVSPLATPSGYGPSNLKSAYALPANGGAGATVAIVDAQDDPNAESDLAAYRTQYGLSACTTANGCFKKVNQTGGTSYPTADSGWAGEISLDLDMVSAVAPAAHIILVEATSANMSDLGTAVNEAVALGAKYVSNSYGGSEDSTDTSSDSSYFNHPGVAITVSAGDSAYGAEYPAASKYVTSVGGTSLSTASNSRGWTESVWSTSSTEGTGSGCSAYDAKPTWQTDTGCSKRTISDVSAVADPATGVAVYDSYGASGWQVYGGTSASSPIIASVYADAGTPGASDYPAKYPYQHTTALNDVTSGSNGSCSPSYLCTAGVGYDGPTGLGTPNGLTAFTAGTGTGGNTVTVTGPGNQSGTVGTAVSLQISASDSGSSTLTYSASGLPAGLSINSSTGLISGTPTTAGTSSVTVTATDATGASGSASFSWTIATSGGGGGCTAAQLLGNPGFETGSASPWTASSGVIDNSSSEAAHSGSWKAWLDGYGSTHTDTLSQSVTVPAGCTTATLTFWLHIDTAETTTSTAYDTLKVQATSGGTTTTLATYSNLNKGTGYTQRSFSLSSYVGQTVTLKFTGVEDSSLQTSFVIDDTAINVS
ncbi:MULTISPECIES: putative Ig domain-containing protein [Streptacidiphilus]|uniref:Ig domain-containing protein n=1 Tax=Streptacidiphilus cavernicola TaxID=3342716 RepID=A0ABV6URY4_9ACTN|nr:putative Ig domain-containing protein [Streptacidiphilus jeojiense]